jgi:protease-4
MMETYDAFKAHVYEGRGARLTKPLDEMAGGRVYTGGQALELGLVDKIGGLRDAIAHAAELADLEPGRYSVRVLPEYLGFWEAFFAALGGDTSRSTDISVFDAAKSPAVNIPARGDSPDARLAALSRLAPAEAKAFMRAAALARMLGEERVLAVMPEVMVVR